MKKIIIGFVGNISSGKGAAVEYIREKYGASTYRFSSVLRDLLDRLHLEQTRDNIIMMSEAVRSKFGNDILTETLLADAKADSNPIIILDGIRRAPEMTALLAHPEFVLVAIDAAPEIRYARLTTRRENADDQQKTYEEFLADEARSTEVTIAEVMNMATERIDNNGSVENLHTQLDALLKKYS